MSHLKPTPRTRPQGTDHNGHAGRSRAAGAPGSAGDHGSRSAAGGPPQRSEKYRGFWPSDDGARGPLGSRRVLVIGGSVVTLLLVLAVVGVVVGLGGSERPAGDAAAQVRGALPSSYVSTKSTREMAKLDARAQDSRALTVDEVFTQDVKNVEAQGFRFGLAGTNLSRDCSAATWGAGLQAGLRKYGCNQIIRGVYVSKDAKHAAQFAVINLAQVTGSHEILRNLDPRARDGFITPLTTPVVKSFGTGFSAAYAEAAGHYVVVVWVQRLGGGTPASMNELLNASLAVQKADEFVWQRLTLVESVP